MKGLFTIDIINTIDKNRFSRPSGELNFSFTILLLGKLFKLAVRVLTKRYDYVYIVYGPAKTALLRDVISVFIIKSFSRANIIGQVNSGNYGDNFERGVYKRLSDYLIRNTKTIIFPNRCLNRLNNLSPQKAAYIPNMTSAELQATDDEIIAKLDRRKHKNTFDICYISNMIPEKGYEDLLDAAIDLHMRMNFNFKVHFIGGWPSESVRNNFINKINASGLKDSVFVHGQIIDRNTIKQFFLQADVFVLPTYYAIEAQPLSIIEAFNAATPVISTYHASIPEMIEDGKNGFLVNIKSPKEIAERINLLEDETVWNSMALAARKTYLEKYHTNSILPELFKIFRT
jgi:glycosyltransferase involved in cell wall biosynthesis